MGREKVQVKTKSPALMGCPEKRGVCIRVYTQTPRFSGHPSSAGDFVFVRIFSRPFRTSCENVGTHSP